MQLFLEHTGIDFEGRMEFEEIPEPKAPYVYCTACGRTEPNEAHPQFCDVCIPF